MLPNSFSATVKLIGAPPQCVHTVASMAFIMEEDMVPPVTTIGEFGPISFSQVKARLENFARVLANNPGAMGYVVSESKWPLQKRAMEYLVSQHKLQPDRVKYVNRNKTKDLKVKLYLVPQGARPPN